MTAALPDRWYEAISQRRSRRRYEDRPVEPALLDGLERVADEYRPFEEVRVHLVREPDDDVFRGLVPVGGYGKVRDAPHFLAFIAPEGRDVHVGYVGEALVLEAAARGMGTCWIAGSFDQEAVRSLVDLGQAERVHAVTPVGHALREERGAEKTLGRLLGSHARKPLEEVAPGAADGWPDWAVRAVEAARLAPSGANRQPWRFHLRDGELVLTLADEKTYWTRGYDCGCAALHAELGAGHEGSDVRLELAPDAEPGADVARLVPLGS